MGVPTKIQLKDNLMVIKDYATRQNNTSVLENIKAIGLNLNLDLEKRYSDAVPYEQRKYWYFTLHGLGAGTLPRGVNVLETREGQNEKGTWGDYICLDAILNTSELKEYDLKELVPPEIEKQQEQGDYEHDDRL